MVEKRNPQEWMQLPSDDRILETLGSSGLILTPSIIALNIDISREHASRRISKLEEHGFVERVERGHYEITNKGKRYLEGEKDTTGDSE